MDESQIAHEILAYLSKNPDAQDTIDGIVEWWLLAQHIERQVAKVKSALADLVERGLILESRSSDARIYYRLNRYREKERAEILNQVDAPQ
jgi:DNA-binding PadR family transcriptional regulator